MPRQVQIIWADRCRWDPWYGLPESANDKGLYQISRLFGGYESLLYVGIVWSGTRNFLKRMKEHRKDWLGTLKGINYRFGTVVPTRGLSRTRMLIEELEGAMIFELNPPENTMKQSSYSIRHDLIIHNRGDRRVVPRYIDTTRH